MTLRYNSERYFIVWIVTTGIVMILQTAAAVEAFSNMLSEYRGIGWAVTTLLTVALLVAALTAAVLSGPDIRAIHELSRWVSMAFAARRVLSSVLAVFLLGGSYFLFWFYRVPHRTNDSRHLMLMTSLLAFYAVIFFAQNLDRRHLAIENLVLEGGITAFMGTWLVALRKAGEIRPRSEFESIDSATFQQGNTNVMKALRAARRS